MDISPDELVRWRLATQRLTSAPVADPADAVRLLLCAQAQDAPLARYSLGLRTTGATDASVRVALDEGRLVRTHLLRPTWHIVAAEDLRWLLALTSPKVESSLAGRQRQVGLEDADVERALGQLVDELAGGRDATAAEIGERLASSGNPLSSAAVRHAVLVAELRGLVCSGPLRGSAHTYGLVDERVPPTPPLDRDEAVRRLVRRFFTGHGPASEHDLRQWTTLTLAEIRAAIADLGDALHTVTCDGFALWFDPTVVVDGPRRRRTALLPTFDEAYLPYKSVAVPRVDGHPRGDEPHVFAEAGGGVIIVDGRDAGWWKRTVRGVRAMRIRLAPAAGLDREQRSRIDDEAARLAAFFGLDAEIEVVDS